MSIFLGNITAEDLAVPEGVWIVCRIEFEDIKSSFAFDLSTAGWAWVYFAEDVGQEVISQWRDRFVAALPQGEGFKYYFKIEVLCCRYQESDRQWDGDTLLPEVAAKMLIRDTMSDIVGLQQKANDRFADWLTELLTVS